MVLANMIRKKHIINIVSSLAVLLTSCGTAGRTASRQENTSSPDDTLSHNETAGSVNPATAQDSTFIVRDTIPASRDTTAKCDTFVPLHPPVVVPHTWREAE